LVETPVLRRRAIYHAGLFASFTLFWTAIPILLLSPTFQLSQQGIALFALAGALGVVAAPIAGRLADKGLTKITTALAMCSVAIAFLLAQFGADSLTLLVFAGILLDMGVHCNLVLGQRAIYALKPEIRSRLNALYMTIFFAGGALGSAVASAAYSYGGWTMVAWIGFSFPCIVLLLFITEII
jgi:predicted MFS family arabinose efflux permease